MLYRINNIPLSKEGQDSLTTTYNLDPNFAVDIPTKEDYKEVEPFNYNINCNTNGSNLDDNRTKAGVIINNSHNDIAEEAIHLGNDATVFQAEHLPKQKIRVLSSIVVVRPQLWLLTTLK